MAEDLERLSTEAWNSDLVDLSSVDVLAMLEIMNREDATVPAAVARVLPEVAEAVDRVVASLAAGGRLIYVGAGTSGRLGVLDAAECPPTFSTPPEMVQAVMAGGPEAMFQAQEGMEDRAEMGASELAQTGARHGDVVVGLTASGRTPYVKGALAWGRAHGLTTISVSCNLGAEVAPLSDVAIMVDTGPEVLMGSTRLKAGSAQKMILNLLSTATMVRLGKTYKNLMVDMRATNQKLRLRSVRIVMLATGLPRDEAVALLEEASGEIKVAVAMAILGGSAEEARGRLREHRGVLGQLTRNAV